MRAFFVSLVFAVAVAAPGSVTFSSATGPPSVSLPAQAQAPNIVCNPAWGTVVLPICF
jgi:hypothetical protein